MALNIVGICPAAGQGTRLGHIPGSKELITIGFHPYEVDGKIRHYPKAISHYLIEGMVHAGASNIFMIIGAGKYDLVKFYGDGSRFGAQMAYLYQEELNGMPFALDMPFEWLREETITLFGMPDTLIEPKDAFEQLLAAHRHNDDDVTLGLFKTAKPQKFGMVQLDGRDVVRVVDKPAQTSLEYLWGMAVWNYKFSLLMHKYLRQKLLNGVTSEVVLGDVFMHAISSGLKAGGCKFDDGSYLDIGTVDDLWLTMLHVLNKHPKPGGDQAI